jgi:hypothetical protein
VHLSEEEEIGRAVIRWPKRNAIVVAALVVTVHVVLLLAVIPFVSARLAPSYNQDVFADGYDYLAKDLAAGYGYRFYPDSATTLMREPGYPLVLTCLLLLFGNAFIAVKLVNIVLALGTAWLLAMVVRKMIDQPWAMIVAPTLFLFHPGTLIAESRGGVEILFGFLLVLFIVTLLKALETGRWSAFCLCGMVLGITVLVRSVPIFFPVFLLAYLLMFGRKRMSALAACRNVAIMLLTMLTVLSPWIVRNYSLTGKFVPTASVLGVSAQAGQYIFTHRSEGKPWWLLDREAAQERDRLATQLGYPFRDVYYQTFYRTGDEIRFSSFLLGRVVGVYKQSPGLFVDFVGHNLINIWIAGKTKMATRANLLVQMPYLILAGIGAAIGFKNHMSRIVGPIVLLVGYVISVYIPILAQARYSVPLIPFLSILATIALFEAWQKMNQSSGLPSDSPGADNQ